MKVEKAEIDDKEKYFIILWQQSASFDVGNEIWHC